MRIAPRCSLDRVKRAMARGAVLCGGSAGAICWFNGGHSDSRDPATLRGQNPNLSAMAKNNWDYIRVLCLVFVPGVLCCPHHDQIQSNGESYGAEGKSSSWSCSDSN